MFMFRRRKLLIQADRLLCIALNAAEKYRALGVPHRAECENLNSSIDEIRRCLSDIRKATR